MILERWKAGSTPAASTIYLIYLPLVSAYSARIA